MRTPLRVGLVTDGLMERTANGTVEIANGGVGVYIYHLAKALQAMAPAIACTLLRHTPGQLDVHRDGAAHVLPSFPRPGSAAVLGWGHARAADTLGLDVLHYPNQFGGALLSERIKRVVTLHDLTPLVMPAHHTRMRVLAFRLLLRRSLERADHVIVDSGHTRSDLLAHGLAPDEKITVVPLGVDSAFAPGIRSQEFERRYRLPPRFILTVGVLEPRKNHQLLARALAELRAQGEEISLVIVGRDGWGWKDPFAAPALAHLRSAVHIVRNVADADLPEFYNRAAVFAYPSLYEGFGLPVLEAMACGTPVIAARATSLPEVVDDAALLVDPHDPRDLAQQLLAVLRGPTTRDRLIQAGLRRAAEFPWRLTAERTAAVYARVCGQG